MNASKRKTMQVLHSWVISLRIKRKGTFMQYNHLKLYFVKVYLVFVHFLIIGNVRENRQKSGLRIHQPVLVNMTKKTSSVDERTFVT